MTNDDRPLATLALLASWRFDRSPSSLPRAIRGRRGLFGQARGDQLGEVLHLDLLLVAGGADAVLDHGDAAGAAGGKRPGAGVEHVGERVVAHLLADALLHEGAPAAAAATERLVARAAHLAQLDISQTLQHLARLIVDVVVAPQVAGVVEGDRALVDAVRQLELARPEQAGDELTVVDHLEVATELRVLVLERVQAVGAGEIGRAFV